jgi:hypothetical protein
MLFVATSNEYNLQIVVLNSLAGKGGKWLQHTSGKAGNIFPAPPSVNNSNKSTNQKAGKVYAKQSSIR